jgi:hypothetical protein
MLTNKSIPYETNIQYFVNKLIIHRPTTRNILNILKINTNNYHLIVEDMQLPIYLIHDLYNKNERNKFKVFNYYHK